MNCWWHFFRITKYSAIRQYLILLFCYVSRNISLIVSIKTGHVSATDSLAHEAKDTLQISWKLMAAIRQASGIARQEESLKGEISSLIEYEDDRYLYKISAITILRIILYLQMKKKWKTYYCNMFLVLLHYLLSPEDPTMDINHLITIALKKDPLLMVMFTNISCNIRLSFIMKLLT